MPNEIKWSGKKWNPSAVAQQPTGSLSMTPESFKSANDVRMNRLAKLREQYSEGENSQEQQMSFLDTATKLPFARQVVAPMLEEANQDDNVHPAAKAVSTIAHGLLSSTMTPLAEGTELINKSLENVNYIDPLTKNKVNLGQEITGGINKAMNLPFEGVKIASKGYSKLFDMAGIKLPVIVNKETDQKLSDLTAEIGTLFLLGQSHSALKDYVNKKTNISELKEFQNGKENTATSGIPTQQRESVIGGTKEQTEIGTSQRGSENITQEEAPQTTQRVGTTQEQLRQRIKGEQEQSVKQEIAEPVGQKSVSIYDAKLEDYGIKRSGNKLYDVETKKPISQKNAIGRIKAVKEFPSRISDLVNNPDKVLEESELQKIGVSQEGNLYKDANGKFVSPSVARDKVVNNLLQKTAPDELETFGVRRLKNGNYYDPEKKSFISKKDAIDKISGAASQVIGSQNGKGIKLTLPNGEEKIFVMGEGSHKEPMAMAYRYIADDLMKKGLDQTNAEVFAEDFISQAAINDKMDIGDVTNGKFKSTWNRESLGSEIQPPESGEIISKIPRSQKESIQSQFDNEANIKNLMDIKEVGKTEQPTKPARVSSLKPFEGEGETKQRGLSKTLEAKSIAEGITKGIENLPTYNVRENAPQIQKASEIIANEPNRALRIALGKEKAPDDILPGFIYAGLRDKALKGELSPEVINQLGQSDFLSGQATTAGQFIQSFRGQHPLDPIKAISEIKKSREEAFLNKTSREDINKVRERVQAPLKKEVTKNNLKFRDWNNFVQSLVCK
jgi:hypothetical protein